MIFVWLCSMRTDTRERLSRGSSDRHVSQLQAIDGTPVDVPVPRKVSLISRGSLGCLGSPEASKVFYETKHHPSNLVQLFVSHLKDCFIDILQIDGDIQM